MRKREREEKRERGIEKDLASAFLDGAEEFLDGDRLVVRVDVHGRLHSQQNSSVLSVDQSHREGDGKGEGENAREKRPGVQYWQESSLCKASRP